jgi:hypothetical protein
MLFAISRGRTKLISRFLAVELSEPSSKADSPFKMLIVEEPELLETERVPLD